MVRSSNANLTKLILARHRGTDDRSESAGGGWVVDLRQCWHGPKRETLTLNRHVPARQAMLSERLKYAVGRLLVGLGFLLAASVSQGLVRDGHAVVANRNVARPVNATVILVPRNAWPIEASVGEGACHNVSLANVFVAEFAGSSLETVLVSGSSHSMSCDRGIACGGCGANADCCGMSCCVTALPVNARTLPDADGHALTISTSEQFRAANFGTLFRPPRALA